MAGDEASIVLTIAHEIESYLQRNPRAKDSIDGIRRWWISGGEKRFKEEEIQSALDFMLDRGLIQKSSITAITLYSAVSAETLERDQGSDAPPDPEN